MGEMVAAVAAWAVAAKAAVRTTLRSMTLPSGSLRRRAPGARSAEGRVELANGRRGCPDAGLDDQRVMGAGNEAPCGRAPREGYCRCATAVHRLSPLGCREHFSRGLRQPYFFL